VRVSILCRTLAASAAAIAATAPPPGIVSDAAAGAISQYAVDADVLIQLNKPVEALAAFEQASEALWQALPLHCRTAEFAQSVRGFGQYEPLEEARFRAGETATVYLEPIGYGFVAGGGSFRVELATRVEIRTVDGLILALSEEFGDLAWEGRSPSHHVHVSAAVTLPVLKPGDYVFRLTLTDSASDELTTMALPFAIVE
jgi:hypothetical protein